MYSDASSDNNIDIKEKEDMPNIKKAISSKLINKKLENDKNKIIFCFSKI